jgi:hypothetical protein
MSASLVCRIGYLLLTPLLLQPLNAAAAEGLPAAIKAADARYLTVPDVTPKDDSVKIEPGGGDDEGAKPKPLQIEKDAVKVTLTYREVDSEGEAFFAPTVTVFADGKEVATFAQDDDNAFPSPYLAIQIAELDPANRYPEVVVSFYTGGAHCCSDTSVITSSKDGSRWTTEDVGQFDGSPLTAVDIDGDGVYEFETRDNAFLYAFACYACSEAPLEVLALQDGAIKNVTAEPRYRKAHEAYLKSMVGNAPEEDVNGFLAGYVAEKSLLGEGKEAWDLMLAHYDKASDWGLENCDQPLDDEGECPGKLKMLTFPDALERMLNENGYTIGD